MLKITSIFARPKPYRILMEEYKEDNLSQRMIKQIDELRKGRLLLRNGSLRNLMRRQSKLT